MAMNLHAATGQTAAGGERGDNIKNKIRVKL